jgi:hypothetical protein
VCNATAIGIDQHLSLWTIRLFYKSLFHLETSHLAELFEGVGCWGILNEKRLYRKPAIFHAAISNLRLSSARLTSSPQGNNFHRSSGSVVSEGTALGPS